jgi:hypothetical protein
MARVGLILLASVAIGLAVMWISPANGQSLCFSRQVLVSHLEQKFGEQKVGEGVGDNGDVLEIVASEGGSTWTLFLTNTNGRSCLLASGKDWSAIPFRKPEKRL